MDAFDTNSNVEIKELIFTEHNKNEFIDGNIVYVIDDDYK